VRREERRRRSEGESLAPAPRICRHGRAGRVESGSDHAASYPIQSRIVHSVHVGGHRRRRGSRIRLVGGRGRGHGRRANLGVYFSPSDDVRNGDEERERRDGERWMARPGPAPTFILLVR
jgi:hypothetical protein